MCKKLVHSALVLVLSMLQTTAVQADDPSLVGWWKLDESSGNVAYDSSGHNRHGTIYGDPKWVSGMSGGAIELDGDGDYIELGAVGIERRIPRTITGWAKASTTDIPGWTTVFGFAAAGEWASPRYDIEVGPDGNYHYQMGPNYTWVMLALDTEWHHFAIMSDGWFASSYLDGVYLGGGPGANTTTVDEVRIGNGHGNNNCFPGVVDDVRVYNKALTAEEVKETMIVVGPEAHSPVPADGEQLSAAWMSFQWSPGISAASHDVYIGEDFADVNEGADDTYRGNQATTNYIVGFPGFAYPDGLVMGTTYYWRVDEVEADGITKHRGVVWSFSVLPKTAHNPTPADGARRVDSTTPLGWAAGLRCNLHTVYLGSTFDEVDSASGGVLQVDTTYAPSALEPRKVYFWRVDEFDGVNTHKGNIWTFSTGDFLVVEDFESYTDDEANNETIWQSWFDGFDAPDNGSQVGNSPPPYAEQTIVHGGSQSMPLSYVNTAGVTCSEAERVLTADRDWTRDNFEELVLWFRGRPESVGSFTEDPIGTYTMTGSGTQVFGAYEEFHYAYKRLTGAGSIIAKIESLANTNTWAKAGVMMREALDVGSKYIHVSVTPGNFVESRRRLENGSLGGGTVQGGIAIPHWVKLERNIAGVFTVSHSQDGLTWEPVEGAVPESIQMGTDVYVGLLLTASNTDQVCEAVFSNVTITGTVSSQWGNQDIGITSNAVEPLYIALSNDTGAPAVIYHDDAGAATADTWTEWVIPLQRFADQGVDLTDIGKMAIGLGAKEPFDKVGSGGSGVIYIDDIRLYRPVPN